MGLYCEYDILDNPAFQAEVSAEIIEAGANGQPIYTGEYETIEVDYSNAIDSACEKFEEVATQLVPVDTGYLRSSIWAESDGYSMVSFYAEADYAQYVEFGTWKMPAQEYFRPAVEAALNVLLSEAKAAQAEAKEEVRELVQDIFACSQAEAAAAGAAGIGGDTGFIGGLIGGIAMLALSFVPMLYLYGTLESIGFAVFGNSEGSAQKASDNLGIDIDSLIEIVDF